MNHESALSLLHRKGLTGRRVGVGHLDTGVDATHPAVSGSIAGFCYFDEDGSPLPERQPCDTGEHGTQTAGLICRVAPEAGLYSGAVIEGGKEVVRILAGMEWLLRHDIRVVCISLGVPGYTPVFASAIEQFRKRGILPVAPVGNSGVGGSRSPGNYPGVLSVGAVDENGSVAPFSGSQRFRRADDVQKPNLVAPGCQVAVDRKGDAGVPVCGTSMAAAYVAGIAALLFEARPEASIVEMENALSAGCSLPDPAFIHRYGKGIVDPLASWEVLCGSRPSPG